MKITKITYQKAFITGPFLQEKIGFEADVESGSSVENEMLSLKGMAEMLHKEFNPHLYQEEKYPQPFPDPDRHQRMTDSKTPMEVTYQNGTIPIISKDHERMEIEIDNCSTKEELTAWNKRHDVLPGKILTYYTERLKELENGK